MCVGLPFILEESKLTFLLNCRHENNLSPNGGNICARKNRSRNIDTQTFDSFFKLFLYLYNDYDCHSKRVIPVLLRDESSEKISQTCPNSIKVTELKIPIL